MLKYLLEKEFKQFFRNDFMPKLMILFPVIMLLLFPWAANMEVKDVSISVVDNDRSTLSQRLIQKIDGSSFFLLNNVSGSYDQGIHEVELGHSDIVLEIPAGFERRLYREGSATVQIAANTVNGTRGGLGSSYLANITQDFSDEIRHEAGLNLKAQQPILLETQVRYNPDLDYKSFMIPGIMVMLLTILCGFLPALNIVSEKEIGTIEQINVSPVSKLAFILGKLIPYWVIGIVILSISLLVVWLVYGLTPVGSLLTVYAAAIVYIFCMTGMGLVISNYSSTMQQALFVSFFFIMILLLISGLFTPLHSMPHWAQVVAAFNPLKYFIVIMRSVYLKGSNIADMATNFLAIIAFALLLNGWAVISYRKRG